MDQCFSNFFNHRLLKTQFDLPPSPKDYLIVKYTKCIKLQNVLHVNKF